ncbi:MAG: response regulator [Candidatus Cloacimonetes bacterium]|nr:response regulator [Candidatus Cloacimonadota bacterium]MCF7868230.1 response regulator [Candidatus Cloacimonadota bacterium]MCF7883663.1 response regulator [Candidatus Cloacimonadota bacterium]
MQVLIVEDEFIIAQAMQYDLEMSGFTVCGIAATGDDAIRIAEQNKLDLILMDVNLNGDLDGIDTAKRILKTQQPEIIFMTGYESSDIEERVKQLKYTAFLNKPIDVEMILPLIKKNN